MNDRSSERAGNDYTKESKKRSNGAVIHTESQNTCTYCTILRRPAIDIDAEILAAIIF